VPGKGCFVIIRLYGPTVAAIDKSWKPDDIEKVKRTDERTNQQLKGQNNENPTQI
jgi:hypothetical protein